VGFFSFENAYGGLYLSHFCLERGKRGAANARSAWKIASDFAKNLKYLVILMAIDIRNKGLQKIIENHLNSELVKIEHDRHYYIITL